MSGGAMTLARGRRWRLYSLRSRMALYFGALCAGALLLVQAVWLFGVPGTGFDGAYAHRVDETVRRLGLIADHKKQLLRHWLDERRDDAGLIAQSRVVEKYLTALPAALAAAEGDYLRLARLLEYERLRAKLPVVQDSQGRFEDLHDLYEELHIVHKESGRLLFSVHEDELGTIIESDARRARAVTPEKPEHIDFEDHLDKGYAHLVIARLIGAGESAAALILHLPSARLADSVLDTGRGDLGNSGEVVIVGPKGEIIKTSRAPGAGGSVPGGPAGRPGQLASGGSEGAIEDLDYRGVPVLAAYRHFRISRDVGWGLVVKQDRDEALAPLRHMVLLQVTVASTALVVVLLLVFFAARRLARPLQVMALAAEAIKAGRLEARMPVLRDDEVGVLARTFNAMADKIEASHADLSSQVDQRTAQLVRANRLFATLSQTNQAIVRVREREPLFHQICRIAIEFGRLDLAWIGEPAAAGRLRTSCEDACAGIEAHTDPLCSFAPVLAAMQERRMVVDNDCELPAGVLPGAPARGSVAVLPMLNGAKLEGVFLLFAGKPGYFEMQELALLDEMAQDVSFACATIAHEADRRRTQAALRDSEARAKAIAVAAMDAIIAVDERGRVTYWNPAAERIFGYAADEALGLDLHAMVAPSTFLPAARAGLDAFSARGEGSIIGRTVELTAVRKDGTQMQVEVSVSGLRAGDRWHAVGIVRDITERKAAEAALEHQAFYDPLTHLPNRSLFMDRLGHALHRAQRNPAFRFAVLFLDLDRFKTLNDSLGHQVGDQLLVRVAARLGECVRPGDTVARVGGDEFVVLAEDIGDVADAKHIAERINQVLARPECVDGRELVSTASIGITDSAIGYQRTEDILRDADTAMYRAKAQGRARFELFDTHMHASAMALLTMEADLRRALERREFVVYYQPIVSLRARRVAGFEALVRWRHPERGLVEPGEFIPVAEDTGLIAPIGEFVMDEAARQIAEWRAAYPLTPPLGVTVNLSARQFQQPDLLARIDATLARHRLPPEALRFEITESVLMQDVAAADKVLGEMHGRGLRLYLDDFGTGYSSLAYLQRLPVDALKIDRSFVNALSQGGGDGSIAPTVISLARNFGMDVVAEGVETAEQLERLAELGCDLIQGYHFSRPLPAAEAGPLVASLTVPELSIGVPETAPAL